MNEQIVSFETAKLAKEMGFDEICYATNANLRLKDKKCFK